ncbi:MAG TPA: tetratricopeptide repeat protein [Opitutaceae bacterium]|jgi:tetratricopeptide (TPR) repeat protein|nr:tetratricopeptide repeat protein [Opitutaceae bacterium]
MLSASPSLRARDLRRAALLLVATVLAYLPALRGGLIIDDGQHLTAPELRSLAGLGRIWTSVGATHQYYPLLHSAFWLEHRLWGDAPLGYHLLNVLLHAACAGLLVLLLRRLAVPAAWLAGFLFALHPVNVESVAWIAEQKNTLSLFFYLLAALAWQRWDGRRDAPGYGLATGLFALAVLSKTAAATLPAALLILVWWRRGRIGGRRDVLPLLPWFALGLAASIPTAWLERQFCARFPGDFQLSVAQRILVAGRAFWFYLGRLAWPHPLVFVYPRWNAAAWGWGAWAFPLAAAALIAALAILARRRRGPLAAALLFAAALLPVLGFVNFFWQALSYVGDHLQYLAVPAVFALAAAGYSIWAERMPRAAPACAAAVVALLGFLTWRQSGLYRSPEALYRATLAANPSAWAIHYELGDVLGNQPGRTKEAVAEWEEAVKLKPNYAEAQSNLGCVLAGLPGRGAEAVAHFEAALRARPDFAEAHANLACVLAGLPGRADDAVAHFNAALRLQPDYPEAENALGNLLIDRPGQLAAGIAHLRAAVRLRPDFAEAHWNLGLALAREPARRAEAAAEIEAAYQLDPSIPGAAQALAQLRGQRA